VSRRTLTDDLWLPEADVAQTVQVGHSPLPFDESDCDLPVRMVEIRMPMPREQSIETLVVPRRRRPDDAPTVLLQAAKDPSGLMEEAAPPETSGAMTFLLILIAVSLTMIAAGVLIAPWF
jgi:hypothetical protein